MSASVELHKFREFTSAMYRMGGQSRAVLLAAMKEDIGPNIRDEVKGNIPKGRGGSFATPLSSSIRVTSKGGGVQVAPIKKNTMLGEWYESGTGPHIIRARGRGLLIGGGGRYVAEVHHPGARAHGVMEWVLERTQPYAERMVEKHYDRLATSVGFH